MLELVGDPENRFPRDEAQLISPFNTPRKLEPPCWNIPQYQNWLSTLFIITLQFTMYVSVVSELNEHFFHVVLLAVLMSPGSLLLSGLGGDFGVKAYFVIWISLRRILYSLFCC